MSKNVRYWNVLGSFLFFLGMTRLPSHQLVGPVPAMFFAFVFALILRRNALCTDVLVVFSSICGLVPILGWLGTSRLPNPLTLIATVWVYFSLRKIDSKSWSSLREVPVRLAQAAVAILATIWGYLHWSSFTTGDPANVLAKMFRVWDTSTHFWFYYANVLTDRYVATWSKPPLEKSKG